jgi:hypothetical protein
MAAMTVPAVLALIAANQCVPSSVAPIMVGIALHESGLDPRAVHRNSDGSADVGIAQINTSNFGWLGLTMKTAMDPCRNLAAGAEVLFARYNGSPPGAVRAGYASSVLGKVARVEAAHADNPGSLYPQGDASIDDPPAGLSGEITFNGD